MIFSLRVIKGSEEVVRELVEYTRKVYNIALQLLKDNNMKITEIKEQEIRKFVRSVIPLKKGYSFWEQGAIRYAIKAYQIWSRNHFKEPTEFKHTFPLSVYLSDDYLSSANKEIGLNISTKKPQENNINEYLFKYREKPKIVGIDTVSFGSISIIINRERYVFEVFGSVDVAKQFQKVFKTHFIPYLLQYINRVQIFTNINGKLLLNVSLNRYAWNKYTTYLRKHVVRTGALDIHRDFSEKYDAVKVLDDTIFISSATPFIRGVLTYKLRSRYRMSLATKKLDYRKITEEQFIDKELNQTTQPLYAYFPVDEEKFTYPIFEGTMKYFYGKVVEKPDRKTTWYEFIPDDVFVGKLSPGLLTRIIVKHLRDIDTKDKKLEFKMYMTGRVIGSLIFSGRVKDLLFFGVEYPFFTDNNKIEFKILTEQNYQEFINSLATILKIPVDRIPKEPEIQVNPDRYKHYNPTIDNPVPTYPAFGMEVLDPDTQKVITVL